MKSPSRKSRSRQMPARRAESRPAESTRTLESRLLGAVLIAALAFVIYIPGFSNGFVYDAEVVVAQDTRVHTLAEPARLLTSSYWAFDTERLALYRPLVTLSFATDWAMHDGDSWGFHQTNALAHALASVLVFLLLTGLTSMLPAMAGAALFAVHPVHAEAVASIVGRADIFAAGFSFAALLAWHRLPPRGTAILVTVPALFFLALGSKESAIMLPALLTIFDAATGKLRRATFRDWLRERAWLWVAMALVAITYLIVRVRVLGVFAPASINPLIAADSSEATRLRTALQIWPEILRLLTVPRTLLADYNPRILLPAESWTLRALAGLALVVAAIAGGVYALVRGHGRTGLVLLWTPVALLPVSNLLVPIGVLLAERTLYIAGFAVALGVAAGIDTIATHKQRLRAALTLCAVVGIFFGMRTVARLPAWSTTDEVFRTLLRDRPDSYRAQWQMGRITARDGDLASALAYYRATVELWPYSRPAYIEAGAIATEMRQQVAARWFSERALEHFPNDAVFLRNLAVAAISLNDTTAARAAVERGLRVEPNDPLFNLMRASFGASQSR